MPTYEFRCSNGHDFEHFHPRISDAPSTVDCPQCGAAAERRISGGAGLVFKGSGFYLTDYGKNAHRSGGAAKPAAGGSGDAGAKPDAGGKSDGGAKADAGSASSSGSGAPSAPSTSTPKGE